MKDNTSYMSNNNVNKSFDLQIDENALKEEVSRLTNDEISLGEQLFNLLDGNTPSVRREALKEAHARCENFYQTRIDESQSALQHMSKCLEEFKG